MISKVMCFAIGALFPEEVATVVEVAIVTEEAPLQNWQPF